MKHVLLTIEYDGSRFSGWQRQPGARTVQGTLEKVLERILGEKVELPAVSRTDAGVHAEGQMALLSADIRMPGEALKKMLNNGLRGRTLRPPENADVRIREAREVPEDFDLRGGVKGKTYRYLIQSGGEASVFFRNYRYFAPAGLDIEAMRAAAERILGTHDFACFQAAGGTPRKTTVRTITDIRITEFPYAGMAGPEFFEAEGSEASAACEAGLTREAETGNAGITRAAGDAREASAAREAGPASEAGAGNAGAPARHTACAPSDPGKLIAIDVTGDGFLYNMVRILAGTLIETGLGRRSAEDMERILGSLDRQEAGFTAPPQGLYLRRIYYDGREMPGFPAEQEE